MGGVLGATSAVGARMVMRDNHVFTLLLSKLLLVIGLVINGINGAQRKI